MFVIYICDCIFKLFIYRAPVFEYVRSYTSKINYDCLSEEYLPLTKSTSLDEALRSRKLSRIPSCLFSRFDLFLLEK